MLQMMFTQPMMFLVLIGVSLALTQKTRVYVKLLREQTAAASNRRRATQETSLEMALATVLGDSFKTE